MTLFQPAVRVGAALCLALAAFAVSGAVPDLATVEGQLQAMRRIQCSEVDGKPVTYYWKGQAYSRVPGEPDRVLFRVEGMNVRTCGPVPGAAGKADFRIISREILLYQDPATGEVLRTWDNPWTGRTVEVLHVANDPVNNTVASVGRDGRPASIPIVVLGNQWWLTTGVPLFYTNPLGGDYQKYVGGTYHATELFNFFGSTDDLKNSRRDTAQVAVSWQRISGWLPWMEMGDRAGLLYFHTAGRKLDRWDDLSPVMKAEIDRHYPEYRNPPPLDEQRPNETSWTYFKKIIDSKKGN
ncbi:MAG: DUF1838 domain-containing protein [Gammaproteobacteria bacterium]|nr:DUF1838 domain-containing protein [Gammaproteobacteria bacterium]